MKSLLIILCCLLSPSIGLQSWIEEPSYLEVNPEGTAELSCIISEKKGECRWEKDGAPMGIFPTKYEWTGSPESGDCSLRILNASIEYDDGVWQCQVTASSFNAKDALISQGAQVVVRESPSSIMIQRSGHDEKTTNVMTSAGEDVDFECISSGANPPAKLKWFMGDQEIQSGHTQENRKSSVNDRTWISVSRLTLPINKEDNGEKVRCLSEHPTLELPIETQLSLTVHYPPNVEIQTTPLEYLEEEKDSVTLQCNVDSNPPSTILWRKEGVEGIFSRENEIVFSPVTRHTAGIYICTAENPLGLSEPAIVEIDIKYSPRILSVGPTKTIMASMFNKTLLTCEAEGNPTPRYQWLQKLPSQEVLIRGYSKHLLIENVTYDHQGEFVCKAVNEIKGEKRIVQSEPIRVEVRGAPQVMRFSDSKDVIVHNGEDAVLEVWFCADPLPKQAWHLGDPLSGNNVILAAGTGHGRFIAEKVRKADREDCYISALRINGAHSTDSAAYELRITNDHGVDSRIIHLSVRDHVSQESLIAVIVGSILTVLLLILVVIYVVKADKCCCCGGKEKETKKDFKQPSDLESEKTDVESTHSSNISGGNNDKTSAIPPDALYVSNEKQHHRFVYNDPVFNDSKESLRPDLISSNLNRTTSSSGDLTPVQNKISYNDLCFPKTSNYGSMKKKKHHVGVECRLTYPAVSKNNYNHGSYSPSS